MKKEQISDALNLLNDDIIKEADEVRSGKRKRRRIWRKWLPAAACLALAVYAGIRMFPQQSPERREDLPMLTIQENESGAMGYEGYMAYDISELVNENPWNDDMELDTLPVYQNPLTFDSYFIASGVDFRKMEEILSEIAGRFDLDLETLEITDDSPDEESRKQIYDKFDGDVPEGYFNPRKLITEANGIKIEVDQTLTADIHFEPAVAIPGEYNFEDYAPYEDVAAVAEYLKEKYRKLINIDHPKTNIFGGDYNIYLDQSYDIEFFDMSGSDTDRIINYNFNRVAFYGNHEARLYLVRFYRRDLSQKVGDYPIITAKEAANLLSAGHYITSVPYEMPGKKYVVKVELIYRTGQMEKYYMPYYRFYVELPEVEQENGLKTYGAYYVPAVDKAYITNMPTWDGSFN